VPAPLAAAAPPAASDCAIALCITTGENTKLRLSAVADRVFDKAMVFLQKRVKNSSNKYDELIISKIHCVGCIKYIKNLPNQGFGLDCCPHYHRIGSKTVRPSYKRPFLAGLYPVFLFKGLLLAQLCFCDHGTALEMNQGALRPPDCLLLCCFSTLVIYFYR